MKKTKPKKLTAKQREAGRFLELYGIVHYLLTEQRVPIIFQGKLAYVRCPGVSKEAFKQAIDKKVVRNLVDWVSRKGRAEKNDATTGDPAFIDHLLIHPSQQPKLPTTNNQMVNETGW